MQYSAIARAISKSEFPRLPTTEILGSGITTKVKEYDGRTASMPLHYPLEVVRVKSRSRGLSLLSS